MKVLKKPVVAVLLCAVIVIASTLGNVNRLFGAKCQKITDGFYNGVEVDGFTQKGINIHLQNISGYVDGLTTIARRNGVDCTAIEAASDQFKSVLRADKPSISSLYGSYTALMLEEAELETALGRVALDERDTEGFNTYRDNIKGAVSSVASAGYNESVRSFLGKYDRFPTDTLAALAGVDYPEYFA